MTKLKELSKKGFTLIELMIVVAIIGILAAIAIPKFAELIRKSSEGASKGNLGALRSAMSIYYGDMEGTYPFTVSALTIGGKYLTVIPPAKAPNYHQDGSTIVLLSADGAATTNANPTDATGWFYNNQLTNANIGNVLVNCTHTDTKGSVWTGY
ncbi:MAG: prepilin-type N-terminal cleavage/methylation domain-containing protein [Elusimicrobiota bacterium]